jgi:hypothetical protein
MASRSSREIESADMGYCRMVAAGDQAHQGGDQEGEPGEPCGGARGGAGGPGYLFEGAGVGVCGGRGVGRGAGSVRQGVLVRANYAGGAGRGCLIG